MKEAFKPFVAFILIYANMFGFSLSCKEIFHPPILGLVVKHAIDFAVCIFNVMKIHEVDLYQPYSVSFIHLLSGIGALLTL